MSHVELNATKLMELGVKAIGDAISYLLLCLAVAFILVILLLFLFLWINLKYEHTLRTIAILCTEHQISDDTLAVTVQKAKDKPMKKWRRFFE